MRKIFLTLVILLSISLFPESRVRIIFVGDPGVSVYVNFTLAGKIGENGRLTLSFSSGDFTVSAGGDWYIQVGEPQIVKMGEEVLVFLNVEKASRIRILSNVYPVSVFVDGNYYGDVDSPSDTLKVPAGYRKVALKSEGYKSVVKDIALPWKEVTSVPVKFEKLPKELKIYLSSESFSPNGDWYNDELEVHIYSTFESKAKLVIRDESGRKVLSKYVDLKEGDNIFKWDGKGAEDGVYEITVSAEKLKTSAQVKVDRSHYTYTKEWTIGIISVFLISAAALVYLTMH